MGKWIKVSFSDAKLPFYPRAVSKDGKAFFVGDCADSKGKPKTDVVRCDGRAVRRFDALPRTILTDNVREGEPYSDVLHPMAMHPISNMLCVLCGRKPVPEFYPRFVNGEAVKRDPMFDEIVENGYVRLSSPFKYTKTHKDGSSEEKVISSVCGWAKSAPSNKQGTERVSWFKLRLRFAANRERYNEIMSLFQRHTGILDLEGAFVDVTEAVESLKDNEAFLGELKDMRMTSLTNNTFLRSDMDNKFGAVSQRNGIMRCISLDGEFVFHVPDSLVGDITRESRSASYLDGGFAALEKWGEFDVRGYFLDDVCGEEFEEMGFKKLCNIFNKTEEL